MANGNDNFRLKKGFLSQIVNITSDKGMQPKNEKLKCLLNLKIVYPS